MSVVSKSSQEQSHGAAIHSPASSFLILHGKMLILTSPPYSGTDDTFQTIPVLRWEKLRAEASPHPSKEWRHLRDGLALDLMTSSH